MIGECPCGTVRVTLAHAPEYLNSCNCSLCFRLGTLWGYFDPADVTIEGETGVFIRDDIPAELQFRYCKQCGATIDWSGLAGKYPERMGVNMRLFGPEALVGLPVEFGDRRSEWVDGMRPPRRHASVTFTMDEPF